MTAGIIVAIIALPLSIALVLASGVGPEAGIFTAIVADGMINGKHRSEERHHCIVHHIPSDHPV